MDNHNNQQAPIATNTNVGLAATRVWDFIGMDTPEFLGLRVCEDPSNFVDEVKKIFVVIGNGRVELASYQLKDVAQMWFT